jgi:hypothetical protein
MIERIRGCWLRCIPILLLFVASTALAQSQAGSIVGKVRAKDGSALPGVTVTVSGVGATQTFVTTAEGDFRFLALHPGSYALETELPGFAAVKRQVEVTLGKSTEINFELVQAVTEAITVTAASPVLDRRQAGTGAVVDNVELRAVPTARDPWVVLQSVPGVLVDRVNVGGNESGQQSYFVGKGVERHQTEWNIDGVLVTEMATTGSSAFYYDFDSFDQMEVTTGGADPSIRTPGVHFNMVTKRGSNDLKGSARWFVTDKSLQETGKVPDEAKSYFTAGGNSIDHIDDYGLEAGGPLMKDRIWMWGAYSGNNINNFAAGVAELQKTKINNWNAKFNAQFTPSNNAEVFFMWNNKEVAGRGLGTGRPIETATNQTGPGHVIKVADTHIFGPSFYLTATGARIINHYELTPIGGRDVDSWWDVNDGFHRTYKYFHQNTPQTNARIDGSAYVSSGKLTHELKFGFGYRDTPVQSTTAWPGSGNFGNFYDDYALAALTRPAIPNYGSRYVDTFIGDTVTLGNLTLTGGVRYDIQRSKNFGSTVPANPVVPDLLPSVTFPGDSRNLEWKGFSPRLGATWAIGPASKTLLRASYSRYMDQMGSSDAGASNPFYRVQMLYYYWDDLNGDKTIQRNEIDFASGLYSFSNIDPDHPAALYAPGRLDYGMKPPKTDELVLGAEHELMPSFAVGANLSYRKRSNFTWDRFEKTRGSNDFYSSADYVVAGTTTGTLPNGTAYAVPFYKLKAGTPAPIFFVTTNRPDYYQTYRGLELTATKRMSNHWMLRGNVTLQSWKQHVGQDGFVDPTPLVSGDSCTVCNGNDVGSSGGIGGYINSKWSYSVNGVYELPKGFNLGAAVVGRQGFILPYYRRVNPRDGSGTKNQMVVESFGSQRLPDLFNLDLRIAKDISLMSNIKLNLSVDLFNATNERTVLWRANRLFVANGADPSNNQIAELQSPRVWRLGARLNF